MIRLLLLIYFIFASPIFANCIQANDGNYYDNSSVISTTGGFSWVVNNCSGCTIDGVVNCTGGQTRNIGSTGQLTCIVGNNYIAYNLKPCSPIPTCTYPQFLDDTNTTCVLPTLVSQHGIPDIPSAYVYDYANGYTQICGTDTQTCSTYDPDGNIMPSNIPINGVTYDTLSDKQTHQFISIGGTILTATATGIAIVGSGGLATPAVVATSGTVAVHAGLATASNQFLGFTPYTVITPENDNLPNTPQGIKVDLGSIDFSQDATNVAVTQDDVNLVRKQIQDENTKAWAEFTQWKQTNQIELTKHAPDGSTVTYKMDNPFQNPPVTNDLTSQNNPILSNVTVTKKTADIVNSDGTITKGSVETTTSSYDPYHSSWATQTHSFTTGSRTSSFVGSDSSVKSTNTSTSSDGNITTVTTSTGSADYSPITSRLDQQINQNKKLNDNVDSLVAGLNGYDSPEDMKKGNKHKLDSNLSLPDYGSLSTLYDDATAKFDEFKTLVQGGVQNNLQGGIVSSCAYSNTIDGYGMSIPVSYDPCQVIAPYYDTLYAIWYFLFLVTFLAFFIKLAFMLRGGN